MEVADNFESIIFTLWKHQDLNKNKFVNVKITWIRETRKVGKRKIKANSKKQITRARSEGEVNEHGATIDATRWYIKYQSKQNKYFLI